MAEAAFEDANRVMAAILLPLTLPRKSDKARHVVTRTTYAKPSVRFRI
jgi:hypothetical protein